MAAIPSTDPQPAAKEADVAPVEPNHYAMQAIRAIGMSPLVVPKILIQIGFEPIAEVASKNFLGQNGFRRASILTFWKFLHRKGGLWGLFIGWDARLFEALTVTCVNEQAVKTLGPLSGLRTEQGDRTVVGNDTWTQFSKEVALDVVCNSLAVLASHPFFVISTRSIAQWVCGDGAFLNVAAAARAIHAESGLAGFFVGLVPALLQESIYVITLSFLHKIFEIALRPATKELQPEQISLLGFVSHNVALAIANPFFFPFSTVKAIMAANRPTLLRQRKTPLFGSWTHALEYLYKLNGFGPRGLVRGASNYRRFYAKPLVE
eukprot:m.223525 g.223525  ORF g.223525 m.223525 type:complete len:320 (+) comp16268_c0_seq1:17-976(+)